MIHADAERAVVTPVCTGMFATLLEDLEADAGSYVHHRVPDSADQAIPHLSVQQHTLSGQNGRLHCLPAAACLDCWESTSSTQAGSGASL